ncbi:transporter associated domain-containing protein, partial [Vibrio sp. 1579]
SISPSLSDEISPQGDGSFLIEGSTNIRDINKGLKWDLPTDGPRTLNGLILEHLEDIPESHLSVRVAGHPMEIVEIEENRIKLVRVYPKKKKSTSK